MGWQILLMAAVLILTGCAGTGHRDRLVQGGQTVSRQALQVQTEDLSVRAALVAQEGRFDVAQRLYAQMGVPEKVYAGWLAESALDSHRFEEAGRWFQTAGDLPGVRLAADGLGALGLWTAAANLYRASGLTQTQAALAVGRLQTDRSPVLAVQNLILAGAVDELASVAVQMDSEAKKAANDRREVLAQWSAVVFAYFCTQKRYDLAAPVWSRLRALGQDSLAAPEVSALDPGALGALSKELVLLRDFDLALDCAVGSADRSALGQVLSALEAQPWEKLPADRRKAGLTLLARGGRLAATQDSDQARRLALRLGSDGRFSDAEEILIRLGLEPADRADLLFPLALGANDSDLVSIYARLGRDKKNLARAAAFFEESGDWAKALVFSDLAKDTSGFQRLGAKVCAWLGKNHRDYLNGVSAVPVREEIFLLACLYKAWTAEDRTRFAMPAYWALVRESLGSYFTDQQLRKARELERTVTRMKLGLKPSADEKAVQAAQAAADGAMKKLLAEEDRIFAEIQRSGLESRSP